MNTVRLILISLLTASWCFIAGCESRPATISYYEATGTQAQRVSNIGAMLSNYHALPTPILDANFVEEKIGDDSLGPSDYRSFMVITISPQNLPAWEGLLTTLESIPGYQAPTQSHEWWVTEERFSELHFFAPETLSGRTNGWIAIDPQSGEIFIYSFTT